MAINFLTVVATIIACAAVGLILWWAYGRVQSSPLKALIAVATALLGYVIYFLVQVVAEELYPVARGANGHIIAYNIYIFTLVLAAIVVMIFLLRKGTTTAAK